jgi:hypothetical protein
MRAVALFAVVLSLLLPVGAHAQDETIAPKDAKAEAARMFAAGDQAYAAGKYLAAAGAYEGAQKLHPDPGITFSIAQAYRRHYFENEEVVWLQKARELYKRYLVEQPSGGRRAHAVTHLNNIAVILASRGAAVAPEDGQPGGGGQDGPTPRATRGTEILVASTTPKASASIDGGPAGDVPVVQGVTPGLHRIRVTAVGHVDRVLDVIASEGKLAIVPIDLEPLPGSLRVRATIDDATVWINGRHRGVLPASARISLAPGRHTVAVSASGHDLYERTVDVGPGEEHAVEAELSASRMRIAAYATFASSGAFLIAGAVLAGVAADAESQAVDARSGTTRGRALTPTERDRSNEALERRDLTRTLSGVSFGAAGVSGLTGTLLFALDNPTPNEPEGAAPQGAAFAWYGTF